MSTSLRSDELARFGSDPEVSVMLFSLLAGSTGLNLTVRLRAACRGCAGVLQQPQSVCDALCLLWSVFFCQFTLQPPHASSLVFGKSSLASVRDAGQPPGRKHRAAACGNHWPCWGQDPALTFAVILG